MEFVVLSPDLAGKAQWSYLPSICRTCLQGRKVSIYLTFDCNRTCAFCLIADKRESLTAGHVYVGDQMYLMDDLKDEVLGRILLPYDGLVFSGGEPLQRSDDVLRLLTVATRCCHPITTCLFTNGDFLSNKMAASLKGAGLDAVKLSLHDSDLSRYQVQLQMIRKYFGIVVCEHPLNPRTPERVHQVIEFCAENRVDCLVLDEFQEQDQQCAKIEGLAAFEGLKRWAAQGSALLVAFCPVSARKNQHIR